MSVRQHLRLYIAGQSPQSKVALFNVERICREYLTDRHCLDIIDIEQKPRLAHIDRIVILPTLVKWFPGRQVKVTGNFSAEEILRSLESDEPDFFGRDLHAVLKYLLQGAMHRIGADMGTVQLLESGSDFLRINAQAGFTREFLDFFRYTGREESVFGATIRSRRRFIVEDVLLSPILFGPGPLTAMLAAGVRSLHCVPLLGRLGDILGIVTVYCRKPSIPFDRDKYLLTQAAQKIAYYIEQVNSLTFSRAPLRLVE
jgi:circadian clock protein KaiB